MTRVAVLADIHGNVPALEAILADLQDAAPDEVLVGGDLVGRGPQGSRVVELIRERRWRSVKGNHEDYLLDFRAGRVPEDWLFDGEWAASRWMAAELSDEDAAYIAALPFSVTSEAEPDLRLVHGSPRSHNEGLGPWCSRDQLAAFADLIEEPLLVCAHTHRPLEQRFDDGRLVVNVGSVGLPFNRDPRAHYTLLERRSDGWRVELRQIPYDRDEIRRIYRDTGFLAAGGITARLLELELEHATPILVPFLEWAKASGIPAAQADLDDFLAFFTPGEPMKVLMERLQALATT